MDRLSFADQNFLHGFCVRQVYVLFSVCRHHAADTVFPVHICSVIESRHGEDWHGGTRRCTDGSRDPCHGENAGQYRCRCYCDLLFISEWIIEWIIE